jgi:hypothetical protein
MLLKVETETEKIVEESSESESHFWAAFLLEFHLSYYHPTNLTPSLTLTEVGTMRVLHVELGNLVE